MWAKSVFLSWPAAAKAWPGSTMTHSLAPLVLPAPSPLGRLALAKRPPTPNCRRQSLFQRWQSSFPISNTARDRAWVICRAKTIHVLKRFSGKFPKLDGSEFTPIVAPKFLRFPLIETLSSSDMSYIGNREPLPLKNNPLKEHIYTCIFYSATSIGLVSV